jgi:glucosamine-6-phosphate deaminase
LEQFKKDNLSIRRYSTRHEVGEAAAADTADKILELLESKPSIRMIFAAAPSQNEFLAALSRDVRIDFSRITAFHMDEYIGLHRDAPQGFGNFLRARLFELTPFKTVYYLDGNAGSLEDECARYAGLLREKPIDIVCMGIGENAHIAFNDPGVAEFDDPCMVKIVKLDNVCRQQQVNDGCFTAFGDVPRHALTLSVTALMRCAAVFCVVPGVTKQKAVFDMLYGDISESCPASVLRTHPNAVLYLDKVSGALVEKALDVSLAPVGK